MSGNLEIGCAHSATVTMARVKQSVAVMISRGDQILAIRRSDTDDELPGIWGLPASTLREGEHAQDLIARIGRDKLGVTLIPLRRIAAGVQERPSYRLEMELWEVLMEGMPTPLGVAMGLGGLASSGNGGRLSLLPTGHQ